MSDDEMKKRVLARRAQFIAAAVAGMVACEPGQAQPPVVCLSISVPPPENGGGAPTMVDAGVSADPDAAWSAPDASTATPDPDVPPMACLAPPLPCLSVAPQPTPMVDAGAPHPARKPMPLKPAPTSSTPKPRVCLSFGGD